MRFLPRCWTRQRRRQLGSCAGLSLMETVVSTAVFSVLGGGVFSVMMDSDGMFKSCIRSTTARKRAVSSFEVLKREVEQARLSTLTIDSVTDVNGDILTIQLPMGLAGTDVQWGAPDPNNPGAALNGGSIRFQVQPQGQRNLFQLTRQVLDVGGNPVGPVQILTRDVDAPGARGKGFQVVQNPSMPSLTTVELRLRVGAQDAGAGQDGEDVVKRLVTPIRIHTQ